ncbi:MAG: ABC transporter substrate-binding protein [Clostridiales bacterium]|nr:ABC transporter substrate-binding protein [Clostridiales bacterium]
MKKTLSILLAVVLILSLLGACAKPAAPETDPRVFVDSCGREVVLPAEITRIAPSGLVAQMILTSLAPETLVGLSNPVGERQLTYLPAFFADLPVFGQFYGKNAALNLEELLASEPQIIIDMGDYKASQKEDMDGLQAQTGLPTIFIEATLGSFSDAYLELGALLGLEDEAALLASYIANAMDLAHGISARIPEGERLCVMYGTSETGLAVNAKGSLHAEVIELVGAENAVEVPPGELSSKGGGNVINLEEFLLLDPDVILLAEGAIAAALRQDPLWAQLSAVQNDRVYQIPEAPYGWLANPPSVNRVLGIYWLGNLLYPDYYDVNIVEEIKLFYRLFWHYELTDAEVAAFLR